MPVFRLFSASRRILPSFTFSFYGIPYHYVILLPPLERLMEKDFFVNDVEAAKILSCSPQTLRNYRHLGKGPIYSKRGAMVRYRVVDLLDYMAAGRIEPEARREAAAR
jgi:hypothetical protein